VSHDNDLMSMVSAAGSAALGSMMPSAKTLSWMADTAMTMGKVGLETGEIAMEAAPLMLEAAEFLLPLILLAQENRVSAQAEIRRYTEVVEMTRKFGD